MTRLRIGGCPLWRLTWVWCVMCVVAAHGQLADQVLVHAGDPGVQTTAMLSNNTTPASSSLEKQLISAARNNDTSAVTRLIEAGASPDASTAFMTSALWSACFRGYIGVVLELLEAGARVDKQNQKGTTPLFVASQNGHRQVVGILLERGANVNHRSNSGSSALMAASFQNHPDIVTDLIAAGADVNLRTHRTGQTALWSAAFQGYGEVVSILLDNNADVSISDSTSGASPLYVAVRSNHLEISEQLISRGADVNKALAHGFSPLHVASAIGSLELVRLLLRNGANVDAIDVMGQTPIDVVGQARGGDLANELEEQLTQVLGEASRDKGQFIDTLDPIEADVEEQDQGDSTQIANNVGTPTLNNETGRAGAAPLTAIIVPVVLITVVLSIILITWLTCRQRAESEHRREYRTSHRQRVLNQPMMVHNIASEPPRGLSPVDPATSDPIMPHELSLPPIRTRSQTSEQQMPGDGGGMRASVRKMDLMERGCEGTYYMRDLRGSYIIPGGGGALETFQNAVLFYSASMYVTRH